MVSYDGLDKVIGAKLALAIVKPIVFALVYVRRARAADVDASAARPTVQPFHFLLIPLPSSITAFECQLAYILSA